MTAKKKILYLFSFIVVAYTSFPSPAEGCGGCMISNFDRFLPPVTVWCIFIIVWFLAVSALEGVKSFIRGLLFVIVLSFILLSFLGPFALLPLFLYALLKSITAFSHLRKKNTATALADWGRGLRDHHHSWTFCLFKHDKKLEDKSRLYSAAGKSSTRWNSST